jgi:hypothetical protein
VSRRMATLAFLDASDPPPSREDPLFGGDYKAYRKAYKAWNERERTRRKIAQPQHASDAATQPAAVQQDEATPVKRRRMLPRPRRTDFDTEEDFEDAMAERGAARDLRRQEAHAQAEAERRERLRSGEHAAEVADREADRKRGARLLAAALHEARAGAADNEAGASSCRDDHCRRLEQQDLILALEEMLEPRRARCYADVTWCDAHLYGAVVEWAHEHKPDGTDAWEDELIAVAMDAARRRVGPVEQRVGARKSLEEAFAARYEERFLMFSRWPSGASSPDPSMPVLWRAERGYCVCGCSRGRHYSGGVLPFCRVHNREI